MLETPKQPVKIFAHHLSQITRSMQSTLNLFRYTECVSICEGFYKHNSLPLDKVLVCFLLHFLMSKTTSVYHAMSSR